MTYRGQIRWALLSLMLTSAPVVAEELALDEFIPTAENAVAVTTLQDDFLTPTYSLPASPVSVEIPLSPGIQPVPENVDILTEIFGDKALTIQNRPTTAVGARTFTPTKQGTVNTQETLLTPLPPLPQAMVSEEEDVPPYTPYITQTDTADQALQAMKDRKNLKFTMPREVRITFYPGQASFSAQSLKWVKAFALKTKNDPRYMLDLRVSSDNWPLQSKRVGLLIQTMLEQGVSRHQIRVFKSEREENTILLGCNAANILPGEIVKKESKRQKTLSW